MGTTSSRARDRKYDNEKKNTDIDGVESGRCGPTMEKKFDCKVRFLESNDFLELKAVDKCYVCYQLFNNDVNRMTCLKPCGHILCYKCARTIVNSRKLCHQCRAKIPHPNKILFIYK